jgi:hypothetical protein
MAMYIKKSLISNSCDMNIERVRCTEFSRCVYKTHSYFVCTSASNKHTNYLKTFQTNLVWQSYTNVCQAFLNLIKFDTLKVSFYIVEQ